MVQYGFGTLLIYLDNYGKLKAGNAPINRRHRLNVSFTCIVEHRLDTITRFAAAPEYASSATPRTRVLLTANNKYRDAPVILANCYRQIFRSLTIGSLFVALHPPNK